VRDDCVARASRDGTRSRDSRTNKQYLTCRPQRRAFALAGLRKDPLRAPGLTHTREEIVKTTTP